MVALLVVAMGPGSALAAEETEEGSEPAEESAVFEDAAEDSRRDWLSFMPGVMGKDAVFLGMWSYHFISGNSGYNTSNDLIGISYAGFYGGTFVNSDFDRSWAVGAQRDFYQKRWGRDESLRFDAGYRLGILHGYDSYQIGNSGFFPMLQIYGDVSYKRVGVQFSWAAEVFTAGFFYRFGD